MGRSLFAVNHDSNTCGCANLLTPVLILVHKKLPVDSMAQCIVFN